MSKTYLKMKIVSLAAEARLIRREEKNWYGPSETRTGLYLHRVLDVRREARAALLAYGFIRGRLYSSMEKVGNHPQKAVDFARVLTLARKYGPLKQVLEAEALKAWVEAP